MVVAGLKSHNYMERLKELGMTTLEERQHQLDKVQVYKIVKGVGGENNEQWFKMADNKRTTRGTDPLNIQDVARLETRKNFSPTECQKQVTMCRETLGKLVQLRHLKRPAKTTKGRYGSGHLMMREMPWSKITRVMRPPINNSP
jgi:hypothetical protein